VGVLYYLCRVQYIDHMQAALHRLGEQLDGELHYDSLHKHIYATDASVYKALPIGVALPKHKDDIKKLIDFAIKHKTSLIPRAGGTSLAGQCVGDGLVVDVSKFMNKILEVNAEEGWVRVQPGVIRDELNAHLKPLGLFFGPNTSTANRAMIGGMVGNNSCGSTSIVYGSTRDHVLALEGLLSDGSDVRFSALSADEFNEKKQQDNLEGKLYRQIDELLSDQANQERIQREFPKKSIQRRNTGYAVDLLLDQAPFKNDGPPFNFCNLLCGSEGTLAFTTEIKLHIDPLPEPEQAVLCAHFYNLQDSLKAVLTAMAEKPSACELMDKIILDLTKENIEQSKNRFFVEGDPETILMVEFRGMHQKEATQKAEHLKGLLQEQGLGYAYPIVEGEQTKSVWTLRKAGLGLLANMPGDAKPVACIEDTAVSIEDLPAYIKEFSDLMARFGQRSVYYAHAGDGELHLRPILNLKEAEGQQLFHDITEEVAKLVKKYDGSLSGEHGDGRVRAAFIPLMVGEENYQLFRSLKQCWDPLNILNPGKIVDTPPMNSSLRYEANQETPQFDTVYDFSATDGILRAAEKCNGSGDCRKLNFSGGTMCPSYRASRDEKDTTRARANVLREFLTMNVKENPFNHPEIYEAMDLCLACKGCTSECPSNVDMTTLKSEFLYQYHKANGVPLRSKAFANISRINKLAAIFPSLSNFLLTHPLLSSVPKRFLGVAPQRSLPTLYKTTLRRWYRRNRKELRSKTTSLGKVYLFCDEFTNYNDTQIGIQTIELLSRLGYEVIIPKHDDSGRAQMSKGLLDDAQRLARRNVSILKDLITEDTPLIGIEPSAILSFKDEYPKLVDAKDKPAAEALGKHAMMVEAFLRREIEKGNITSRHFTTANRQIALHGHCHQKALASVADSAFVLSLPENYQVQTIPSGCCGMAGSFGYEAEHYEMSMKIGSQVLFPSVTATPTDTIIAAPGTSCRHQIADGTGRQALHPVSVLWSALA
jgi:FAD/FMN-containing dehydrogenase/Fe-S oxidoreductase